MRDAYSIDVKGLFRVKTVDRNGLTVFEYEDYNTICVSIKGSLANLIVGANVAAKKISVVGIGTDGTARDGTVVDFAQIDPANKFVKNIVADSWTFPETNQVTINWILDYNEPDTAMAVQEYGLFTAEGNLIARKIKPVINKTNEVSMLGSWTLLFN